MTMTVRQYREWLETFEDQDAIVQVIDHNYDGGYYAQGGVISIVEFDPTRHTDYTDLRGNPFVDEDSPHYNRRTLLIGRSE